MGRVGRDRYLGAYLSSIRVTVVEIVIYTTSVAMLAVGDWWLVDSFMRASSGEVAGALGVLAALMGVMTLAIAAIDAMAIVDLVQMVRRRGRRGT